jgi:ABC-type multidrug transport system fused ATPase/permease subunit
MSPADPSPLESFQHAIEDRVLSEQGLAEEFGSGPDETERSLAQLLAEADALRDTELSETERNWQQLQQEIQQRYAAQLEQLEQEHRRILREVNSQADAALAELQQQKHDSEWVLTSVLDDTAEGSPKRELERFKSTIHNLREEQHTLWSDVEEKFRAARESRRWQGPPAVEPEAHPQHREEAQLWFSERIKQANERYRALESLVLPPLFSGLRSLIVFFVLAAAIAVPFFLLVQPQALGIETAPLSGEWFGISAGIGAGVGLVLCLILYTLASMQEAEAFRNLQQATAEAGWLHQLWLKMARDELQTRQQECERRQKAMLKEREVRLQQFASTMQRKQSEIEQQRTDSIHAEQERYSRLSRKLQQSQHAETTSALDQYQQERQSIEQHWLTSTHRHRQNLTSYRQERQRQQLTAWNRMKQEWEQACQEFQQFAQQEQAAVAERQVPWDQLLTQWQPAQVVPASIPFGHYDLQLENWPGAISRDVRLAPRVTRYQLPAQLRFPEQTSALLTYEDAAGGQAAGQVLRTLALRLLTLMPPGKLRFTLIDPIGLGESFAGLMHLTDFDELLVSHRIWTEPGQIEQRLADLTEHMENVLQKYLRNEFSTIEEYNTAAGEVAEPYHFLIIRDFPAKFSEIAARRLISIIHSGPRCGVYTLLSSDLTKPLPHQFTWRDVEPQLARFTWREGALRAVEEPWAHWPIQVDEPPPPETLTRLVRRVGAASQDARRVEVSFSRIAPQPEQIWSQDSRSSLEIPLGRAGATKLQRLQLGRGTSQHMLIAGKTGSGKSTFLHILITNLALHYSPDEVNFFLIDFKKGVEFKDYAALQLPHARVIAIESDREFGVSALQKLDEILQERGELFRKHGVQDIAGFRNAQPETPLPRILLVVDEFQEFFIEDDKLSQAASLLLDRLVRQGRAFGIHVVLGSQTLGGAYSLARSTLGQVAVRVALQCSEADAHLILSEENTAARLLTRPGEAIYNDANGLSEGNHPFQIAWLEDREREQAIQRLRELARQRRFHCPAPVVFEGNIPSDITRNDSLSAKLTGFRQRSQPEPSPVIWLGDAVEIGPPTALALQRQSGQNVALVGQDAEAVQGVFTAAVLAWTAAQAPSINQPRNSSSTSTAPDTRETAGSAGPESLPHSPPGPVIYLLSGHAPETAEAAHWRNLLQDWPVPVRLVSPAEATAAMQELAALVSARQAQPEQQHPAILVLVEHLARFRDLRKGDDDFSLGLSGFGTSGEKPKSAGQLLAEVLAKGPETGVHVVIWADTYSNLDRWISRQSLREIEQRIAFQMNPNDSSSYIDTPAAGRLGPHRALLYREESGTLTKFRPYGIPSTDWLQQFRSQIQPDQPTPEAEPEPELATDLSEFDIVF